MTKAQALKLARGKWGADAFVQRDPLTRRLCVGMLNQRNKNRSLFIVHGSASTWEEACRKAGLV